MFEEWPALVGKQRFRRAHSARGPAGEDYGGEHLLPFQRLPVCKMGAACASYFNFLCAAAGAFRGTATSSAAMLTAISSGGGAPISSSIGAVTRPNSSALLPSFSV